MMKLPPFPGSTPLPGQGLPPKNGKGPLPGQVPPPLGQGSIPGQVSPIPGQGPFQGRALLNHCSRDIHFRFVLNGSQLEMRGVSNKQRKLYSFPLPPKIVFAMTNIDQPRLMVKKLLWSHFRKCEWPSKLECSLRLAECHKVPQGGDTGI